MSKATHNGTCQVCGRVQAVRPNGLVAKHGYRVADFGYFMGTCTGSDEMPLEVSKEIATDTIEHLEAFAAQQDRAAAGEITKVYCSTISATISAAYKIKRFYTEAEYLEAVASAPMYRGYTWASAVTSERSRLTNAANDARSHIAMLAEMIEARHGAELYERRA